MCGAVIGDLLGAHPRWAAPAWGAAGALFSSARVSVANGQSQTAGAHSDRRGRTAGCDRPKCWRMALIRSRNGGRMGPEQGVSRVGPQEAEDVAQEPAAGSALAGLRIG